MKWGDAKGGSEWWRAYFKWVEDHWLKSDSKGKRLKGKKKVKH